MSAANDTTATADWLDSSLNVTNATFPASPASWHICVLTNYCKRNTAVGALGVVLNLLVVPVICRHNDLTLFLKATVCCLICDDLLFMSTTLAGGLLPADMPEDRYHTAMRTLSRLVYLAGNVNCLVMATIAAERVLALRRPGLFKRLRKISKMKAALVQLFLWAAAVLLTLPILLNTPPDPKAHTPLAIVSDFALAMEASIVVSCSMIVCVIYTYLACTLKRHSALPPDASVATSSPQPSASASRPTENIINSSTRSNTTTTATTSSQATSFATAAIATTSTSDQHNSRQLQRFRRATIHSAVLGVWFLMAYTPFGLYYIFLLVSDADRKLEQKTTRITILSSFPLLNGLVDPMLLFWRLVRFRSIGEWLQHSASWFTGEVRLVAHRLRRVALPCRHRGRCFEWWRRRRRAGRNRVGGSGEGEEGGGGGGEGTEGGGLKTVVVDGPGASRTIRVREAPKGKRLRFVSKHSTPSTSSSAPVAKSHPSPSSSSPPSPNCRKGIRMCSIPERDTAM